jgi:hypothetical protein
MNRRSFISCAGLAPIAAAAALIPERKPTPIIQTRADLFREFTAAWEGRGEYGALLKDYQRRI